MGKNNLFRVVGIFCLVAVSLLMIITLGSTQSLAKQKYIKIGADIPIAAFPPGIAWKRGYELFADKVNKEGGLLVGKERYLIDLYIEDSGFNPDGAATAARKLVYSDGVQFVFGAVLDASAVSIYNVTKKAGALYLAFVNIPGVPGDVSKDHPLKLRFAISNDVDQFPCYEYALQAYPGIKRVVISAPNIGYDEAVARLKKRVEDELGLQVVGTQIWPSNLYQLSDFMSVETKNLSYNPDLVHSFDTAQAGNEIKSLRDLGFKGPIISDSLLAIDVILSVAGTKASTDIIAAGLDVNNPPTDVVKEMMSRWEAKYSEPFHGDTPYAWDTIWTLTQVMQRAGSVDPKIVDATAQKMSNLGDIQTSFGPGYIGGLERFGANKVLVRPVPLVHVMHGKTKLIKMFTPEE